jgi:hypothetical protein
LPKWIVLTKHNFDKTYPHKHQNFLNVSLSDWNTPDVLEFWILGMRPEQLPMLFHNHGSKLIKWCFTAGDFQDKRI